MYIQAGFFVSYYFMSMSILWGMNFLFFNAQIDERWKSGCMYIRIETHGVVFVTSIHPGQDKIAAFKIDFCAPISAKYRMAYAYYIIH
ncbi:hypothetical protein [Pseudomonas syringae group genomosp. 3]|uniref:hypothetical protein n=1 Tax=Pseudomonas syringae group genomosp. 3 TaxID=251701 RepID=UPI0005C8A038|nr:hypothetical protein [Pseudomonas syringae group genomosp. 3]